MHGDSWDFRDASMYLDVANADVTDVLKDRGFRFYRLENLHSEDCPIRLVQCIPCGEVAQQYQMMSHACLNQRRCCVVNDVHGVSMVQGPCPCQFTTTERCKLHASDEDVMGGVRQKRNRLQVMQTPNANGSEPEVHASGPEPTDRVPAEDWLLKADPNSGVHQELRYLAHVFRRNQCECINCKSK